MKRKDFENLWFLLKAVYRQEKKTFYTGVGIAVLEAVNPYIFVILLGMIVDAAFSGMDLKGILWMTGTVMGIKFVLEVLQSRLSESFMLKYGLSIIISICIVAPMFKAVHNERNFFAGSAWCSALILVLLGILTFVNCKISVGGTRKAMQKFFTEGDFRT